MTASISDPAPKLSVPSGNLDRDFSPRVIYLAAGAAGMYCGSCLRDNRLAATLIAQGRDVTLVPLYTPLKTDEPDVSTGGIYYGGINVYLDQASALFRRLPRWATRFLDARPLLRMVSRFASHTRAADLGPLTVSVLKGELGPQRRELRALITALTPMKPDLINLPDVMFVGVARELKHAFRVPIVCTLSGEDIFLDALPEPYRRLSFDLIRQRAGNIDAYVAVTDYFARHSVAHFGLPAERMHVVRMGVRTASFPDRVEPPKAPFTIGYLGRICPEKGLANLTSALDRLRADGRDCRVRAAGYMAASDRPYLDKIQRSLADRGLSHRFEYLGEVSFEQKVDFLRSLHVLSVPTDYPEAKGFSILEALATGVPVAQPNHGSFPELIEATGGGLLYDPHQPNGLSDTLARLMDDADLRRSLGEQGQRAVRESFTDEVMARETWDLYRRLLEGFNR